MRASIWIYLAEIIGVASCLSAIEELAIRHEGGIVVSESILRIVKNTPAVEAGFLAAGLTVSVTAALQCVVVVLSWI
jgi:hypothetical protein